MRVFIPSFDPSPWGVDAPRGLDRFILAVTRGMPDNWLGLRIAMIFRRVVMSEIGEQGCDTTLSGMRLLPRQILIEDTSGGWTIDRFAMPAQCGYTELARSWQNVPLRLA